MTPAELLPQVYAELRKLASAQLAAEREGHTLDTTALVHEAYLKLGGGRSFATPADYLRAAAVAMRRILVDHARARNAAKRGGGRRLEFDSEHPCTLSPADDFVGLDEALSKLAAERPQVAELVHLRYFGGLTRDECAKLLGVSPRTADTWWSYARAWLAVELAER